MKNLAISRWNGETRRSYLRLQWCPTRPTSPKPAGQLQFLKPWWLQPSCLLAYFISEFLLRIWNELDDEQACSFIQMGTFLFKWKANNLYCTMIIHLLIHLKGYYWYISNVKSKVKTKILDPLKVKAVSTKWDWCDPGFELASTPEHTTGGTNRN